MEYDAVPNDLPKLIKLLDKFVKNDLLSEPKSTITFNSFSIALAISSTPIPNKTAPAPNNTAAAPIATNDFDNTNNPTAAGANIPRIAPMPAITNAKAPIATLAVIMFWTGNEPTIYNAAAIAIKDTERIANEAAPIIVDVFAITNAPDKASITKLKETAAVSI